MAFGHRTPLTILPGLTLGVLALLGAALVVPVPPTEPELKPVGCIGACAHPTNAGKVFRWGREAWRQEFEVGPFGKNWKSNHPRLIGQQFGMLTLKTTRSTRKLTVWPDDQAARYGRWEARVRAVEKDKTGGRYRFTWELAPTNTERCGDGGIVMARYTPDDAKVKGSVHGIGHHYRFDLKRDLRPSAWHTYAVEVTPDHISWFVDTHVIRTERRPKALTGYRMHPRFVLKGKQDTTMRTSWMQMDWVRYYTLDRPNAKSIKAPRMAKRDHDHSC